MNTEDLYRLLRTGHIQAQGIVDTVSDSMLVLDSGLCVQNANRAFFETFKVARDETIGRHIYEIGDRQWDILELRRLLAEVLPRSTAVIDYEVDSVFPILGRRTMLLTARTLFHPDGTSHTMLLSIVDVTDRQRRDTERDLLFGELRHRMKNMLGVAQSMARHTQTEGRSAEEYRDAFLGRFSAMIEAEELAFAEQQATGLDEVLKRILEPFWMRPDGIVIESGGVIELSPRTISSLSMVLHEMATNAAKYGALSRPEGQVHVAWRVEEDSMLRLSWAETGGPSVSPPTATGFGTKLIRLTVSRGLRGTLEQEYSTGGFVSEIVFPLEDSSLQD